MKLLTASLLILSFPSIAVLGIFFHPDSNQALTACLAYLIEGRTCPAVTNILTMINFHFDAIKTFTANALVFVLILAVVIFINFGFIPPAGSPLPKNKIFKFHLLAARHRFKHWLAFHENSPNSY